MRLDREGAFYTAYEDTRGGNKRIDSVPQNLEDLHPILAQMKLKIKQGLKKIRHSKHG
ncbi:hypothetical protein [Helicobacter sp. 11S03491-1]|uniref:hypothetical protein n=1 Tax=Helicobacter sp. 11S03491-1 TaxID=1476196 RepID=UPI0015DB232F|nr:hypothetical protein [Helicobacter sp. 11S03491-1]